MQTEKKPITTNGGEQGVLFLLPEPEVEQNPKPKPKRTRKADYSALPQGGLPLHPENALDVDHDAVDRMQATMFEDGMVDLKNAEVSDARKRETWNWVLDPLVREDQGEPFTFRACCQSLGVEVFSAIHALAWQRRHQIDRIFGPGTATKVARAAEERIPVREDDMARVMGGAK